MGSMVMCLIGLLIRAVERLKQREKCSNVQMFTGTIFPHTGAYIIYIRGFYMPHSTPFTTTTKHLGRDISGTT